MKTDFMVPNRDISLAHPVWACDLWRFVQALEAEHAAGTLKRHWRAFEIYRHPDRQDMLLRQRTTQAGAWHSPHQYGLAADFVEWSPDQKWVWPTETEAYAELHALGRTYGILFPISWDRGHAQSPHWSTLRTFFSPSRKV